MTKLAFDPSSTSPHKHHHNRPTTSTTLFSPKLSIYLLATCVSLFVLFQIQTLHKTPPPSTPSPPWSFLQNFQTSLTNCTKENISKLQDSIVFLPLKDLRYSHVAQQGHTWFMSSMYDTQDEGHAQFQQYPSKSSQNRLLCFFGRDTHDGVRNSYAFAWPEALPSNATLMKGLTFISYNHYNYDNIWHGLSAMVPFVSWHIRNGCGTIPSRWILYHWGELRVYMSPWLRYLMEAMFDGPISIEKFEEEKYKDGGPMCFENAVIMRHNEGGMSREKRMEVYDLMRCKARKECEVGFEGRGEGEIGMTLFMRTGARSFRNDSAVVGIFGRECEKVEGCKLRVAYSNNLTICEQVKLMSSTDILVSPHGAQLTNLFLMDRNSSVMEFFPKGWLKLAGVGQFVYHWMASWSGMRHEGAWRDPHGDHCPYSDDDRRCMSIYKSGKIGHNETYFAQWARNTLNEVKMRKAQEASNKDKTTNSIDCPCT